MSAKRELSNLVGAESVTDAPEALSEYASDESFVYPMTPTCVVRPNNGDEVHEIVRWANASSTPLIPVSSGGPHFRGDTVPSVEGAVVVDLRRMNRIVRLDHEHRVAMVEPGVTFRELIPAAREAGLRLNLPLLPRSTKSVVGSMLEREPVIMPKYHWDISDPLACTEVIYGSGEVFRTGSAAGPGTLEEQWAAGAAQNEAAGPMQAGFLRLIQGGQGTMGIVTWATVRCEHLPSIEEPYLVGSKGLDSLLEFAHWLIRNRLADDCLLMNDSNLARIMAQDGSGDHERLRSGLPGWILFYTISGVRYFPEERISYVQNDILDLARSLEIKPERALGEVSAFDLMELLHEPSSDSYWKLNARSHGNAGCADVFSISTHERLQELIGTMQTVAAEFDYEHADLGVYLQPLVQGVNYHCEFDLFFDKDDSAETERVRGLTEAAATALSARGAFFSRPYGPWADMAYGRDTGTAMALRKVKAIFDPNNVMNPGKLCFQ
jgi:FAD/FMN-containing dehydrogenase